VNEKTIAEGAVLFAGPLDPEVRPAHPATERPDRDGSNVRTAAQLIEQGARARVTPDPIAEPRKRS
jgi:hypothetical protein